MVCQLKMVGRVLRVNETKDKQGKPVCYVSLGYIGGKVDLSYRGPKPPTDGLTVSALVEGEFVSGLVYGGERSVILPRSLVSFEPAKDVHF